MATTQSEKSYFLLREKLEAGDFVPGERLVNRTLAEEFGVSVIPVREAINRLASEGLVSQIPGSGAFVREPDESELRELRIFRECIESSAAAEAARHISDRELEELTRILAEWKILEEEIVNASRKRATPKQMSLWMKIEEKFHGRIVEASRNRFIGEAVRDTRVLSRVFEVDQSKPGLDSGEARETWKRHERLVSILATRDPEAARVGMIEHING